MKFSRVLRLPCGTAQTGMNSRAETQRPPSRTSSALSPSLSLARQSSQFAPQTSTSVTRVFAVCVTADEVCVTAVEDCGAADEDAAAVFVPHETGDKDGDSGTYDFKTNFYGA